MVKNELYEGFGKRLREARLAQHLTQEQAAERIGIVTGHLGRAERGECGLGLENLYRLKTALHVDLNYLFTGKCDTDDPVFLQFEALVQRVRPEKRDCIVQLLTNVQELLE